jgi:hypothetical protein
VRTSCGVSRSETEATGSVDDVLAPVEAAVRG